MIARGAVLTLAALAARADAKGCSERSHIIGLEHCSRFADWSTDDDIPRVRVELGMFHTGFVAEPFMLGGAGVATQSSDLLSTTANGGMLRVLGGIADRLYVGGEAGIGGVGVLPRLQIPGLESLGYFDAHAIGGWHITLARFGLGAEAAAGLRIAGFGVCPSPDPRAKCTGTETQVDPDLQVRLTAEAYVVPRLSLGVMYGHGVAPFDEQGLAVYLSIHVRPMDGAP